MPANNGKILVIRGGAIGDFILTLPALRLIRENLPKAEIEILGYPGISSLAISAGWADKVQSIEYSAMANFFVPGTILEPDLMTYFESFSVVISYLYDPDHYFRTNLEISRVQTLIEGPGIIDTKGTHAAKQLAKPLESLALFEVDPAPVIKTSTEDKEAAKAFLKEYWNAPLIALHPGSGSPQKNWPLEKWKQLADWFHKHYPHHRLLLVSGEAEDEAITFVEKTHLHARHLPLTQLAAVLECCQFYVGHDTGISHLAAGLGIPCVLMFGPTNPEIWAPQNANATILDSDNAMNELPFERVVNAIEKAFPS